MKPYDSLMEKYREVAVVGSVKRLLDWDLRTYVPPQGIRLRSEQLNIMERVSHRMLTSNELVTLLKESEKNADALDEVQRRNLYLLRREHDIAASVPENLVADLAKQKATAREAWLRAKLAHEWKPFEPELEKVVDLSVKRAEATMQARGASCAFDAMIDDLDKGTKHGRLAVLLADLRASLVPLVRKYSEASVGLDTSILRRRVPIEIQHNIVRDAVASIGYDTTSEMARGRIDETEHPFTEGYFDDVRITVHPYEDRPFDALYDGLHEAGHALYGQNVNHDWMYQPVGEAASMGMHEAMSRFAENMIGRSRSFWVYYLPKWKEFTGSAFSDVQVDNLLRAINKVEPSKIRIYADELTYSLHVMIRFEIERGLFEGELEVSELPQVWNDLYDKYLQIRFDHDGEGVLQDMHWSAGYFGCFQSYVLGNVYGGMLLRKMEEENAAWSEQVEKGRPGAVIDWLRDRVQRWGAMYDPEELVKNATGSPVSPEPFVQYLTKKYSSIW